MQDFNGIFSKYSLNITVLCGSLLVQATERAVKVDVRQVTGRLRNFIEIWKELTDDPFTISCVKGYELRFDSEAHQAEAPNEPKRSKNRTKQLSRDCTRIHLSCEEIAP